MTITLTLARPIVAHGEAISQLTLRAPTTKDVIELGQPILLIPGADGSAGIEVRPAVVARYLTRLAGINPKAVESLDLADFRRAQGVIIGFFGDGAEAEADTPTTPTPPDNACSTASSTSPGSGA